MNFEPTDRAKEFAQRLQAFVDERVYPVEREAGAEVVEELKAEARRRGLWNLFLPDAEHGPGLTNLEYAPLAEIMGRTRIASEACNCSAPDTGNMEVLHQFGSDDQKDRWLRPLLDGEIRSALRDDRARRGQLGRHEHRACASSATATTTSSTAASGGRPARCTRAAGS